MHSGVRFFRSVIIVTDKPRMSGPTPRQEVCASCSCFEPLPSRLRSHHQHFVLFVEELRERYRVLYRRVWRNGGLFFLCASKVNLRGAPVGNCVVISYDTGLSIEKIVFCNLD